MKITILKGLPASGKSTWAKEYCHKNKDWIRVNRDDLRNMRGDYWLPKQEKLITKWENSCIEIALTAGHNVILDATNLNDGRNKSREIELKKKFPGIEINHKRFLDVSVDECIIRDLKRADSVGEKVIRGMYDTYLAPNPVVYDENPELPHCVIFDVDGTLAIMHDRGPYDWDKVDQDLPNKPIVDLCNMFKSQGTTVIILTGRDGAALEKTKQWLKINDIAHDVVYIRTAGDSRKDAIIKKEIFDNEIKGKYYVDLVVDDRDQMVDMWRKELGLTCLQVNYGDF